MRRLVLTLTLVLALPALATAQIVVTPMPSATATAIGAAAWPITAPNGGKIQTGTTAGDTWCAAAYDTDTGPAQNCLLTLTAGTTPAMSGLFGAGTAAAPSLRFGNWNPDTGFYSINATWGWSVGGVAQFHVNYAAAGQFNLMSVGYYGIGAGSPAAGSDVILSRETTAIWQLGLDAAGTTAYTLKSNDRITSDGVGGDLTIAAGRGRGGAGGNLYLQTASAQATTVAGTLETGFDIRNLNAAGLPTLTSYGPMFFTEAFGRPHYIREVTASAFGAAKTLADAGVNMVLGSPIGIVQYREEQTKTTSSWVDTGGALDIDADATNDEGVEIDFADTVGGASGWITTRAAGSKGGGCFEVNITLGDNAGTDQLLIGWRQAGAFDGDNVYTNYLDWSVVGVNNVDGSIFSLGEVNGGGTLSDDSGVNWADGETRTLKSCIAATTGVPTAFYTAASGITYSTITMTNSGTAKTTTIQMIPFISYMSAGADGNIRINWWRVTR